MKNFALAVETLLNSAGLKRLQAQELAKEPARVKALLEQAESLEEAASALAKQENGKQDFPAEAQWRRE